MVSGRTLLEDRSLEPHGTTNLGKAMKARSVSLLKRIRKSLAQYQPWREFVLFVIALISIGLSIFTYVRSEQRQTAIDKIDVERLLDEAVDLIGSNTVTLVATGLREPDKVVTANRLIRDALVKDPVNARAYLLQGFAAIASRDPSAAATAFDRVDELAPESTDSLVGFGMYAGAFGLKSMAVTLFKAALAKDPKSLNVKTNLAFALAADGKGLEAKPLFEEVLKERGADCGVRAHFGALLSGLNEDADGLRHLQVASLFCPNSQFGQMHLGHVLAKTNRFGEALEAYERASALDPSYGGAHFSIGEMQRVLGRYDLARMSYERALKEDGHIAAGYMQLGWLLSSSGKYEEAMKQYRRASSEAKEYPQDGAPNLADLNAFMSNAAANTQQYDDAIEYADNALAIDPNHLDAFRQKEFALRKTHRLGEADKVLQRIQTIERMAKAPPPAR
jgi:tetratricopeptide (TPR) repeat protein